jgi:hypothetical protein
MESESPPDRPRFAAPGRTLAVVALALLMMVGLVGLRSGTHRSSRPSASTPSAQRVRTEPAAPPSVEAPVASPRPREVGQAEEADDELGAPPVKEGPFRPFAVRRVSAEHAPKDSPPLPSPLSVDVPPPPPAAERASPSSTSMPAPPRPEIETVLSPSPPAPEVPVPPSAGSRRVWVQTESGRVVVARVHGQANDHLSVILPDGQLGLGFTKGTAFTDEPFRPATADEMLGKLSLGPFAGFKVRQSFHYLIFYQSTNEFAKASGDLLEKLYKNLAESLRKRGFPVHDAEFPLVAVIFRTESDFRAHKKVDPDIQAYYEICSNRIYFYQSSARDQQSPEVAALRKPQTVAHEGTHQILQNIGIQPRLSAWPLWLVEGLAEYCSPPTMTRNGAAWGGLGLVNPIHMATIRDLQDPLSLQVQGTKRPRIGLDPKVPLVEYLVTRTELTPTDYALSWALTHYLAQKRVNEFLAYLKTMSQMLPLEKRTPENHLAAFRAAFGPDLAKMDKAVGTYLAKLKGYDRLPYYAVMFQQAIDGGLVKRAAIVSQSPSMIRQWLETVSSPDGGPPNWKILPHPTRARALLTAEQWLGSH